MARRVPTSETHLIHPALSISLLAACIAATIAIVAALCGDRSRKKPTPPTSESSSVNLTTKNLETGSPLLSVHPEKDGEGGSGPERNEETDPLPLPLPLPLPPIRRVNETNQPHMPRSASVAHHKGFLVSPSMHLPRSFSMAKAAKHHLPFTKEERMHGRKDKGRQSDSLWTKTIILGEKNKLPNDDEEVYDDNGQKIETYRPKGPRSLPVSRTNSFIDPEAVPDPG